MVPVPLVLRKTNQSNKRPTRRGKGKLKKNKAKCSIKIIGTNADGISSKKESLFKLLDDEKPSAFMIQETKLKREMLISSNDYHIYENVRKNKGGGGIMIGIDKGLTDKEPVVIYRGNDEIEILVVEVSLNSMNVRFMSAYGPQEEANPEKINAFYQKLEEEIVKCEEDDCGLIAEMDANAKLGSSLIKDDPHTMSENGRLLWDVTQRRNCLVVNTSVDCNGVITRSRIRNGKPEKSVLDYVIINQKVQPYLQQMTIDEKKEKVLTRFTKKKVVASDHNIITCNFNIPHRKPPQKRIEIMALRNSEDLAKFKSETTNTSRFTRCFQGPGDIRSQGKKWMKVLKNTMHRCFRKVRITAAARRKKQSKIQMMMDRRKEVKKALENTSTIQEKQNLQDTLQSVEKTIADECSAKHMEVLTQHVKAASDGNGNMNTGKVWKLRKKICPKPRDHLSAKIDKEGKRVTDPAKIQDIYSNAYRERLQHREIIPELEKLKALKERLFQVRLEKSKATKSPDWTMEDLDKVLARLKSGKAIDPSGLVNELFMINNIGEDLKESILIMMNKIKDQMDTPEFMELANIISFYKGKGPTDDIEFERGIFILSIIRMIKDRLIYNDVEGVIEMSDSQVGARTKFNIRNHLFVMYSVINSVKNKECAPIDIHLYDLWKCFDTLWLEECCNDLYEAGVIDDKLALIYEGNSTNNVAVKTPAGMTERMRIDRVVTQGGVLGPVTCAVHTDRIGKDSLTKQENLYLYKGNVKIPSLAMIDDIAKISECGINAVKDNAYIDSKFEQNKLLANASKCHKMHVGKASKFCPVLTVHDEKMDTVDSEKYVGDLVSNDGKHTPNILARRSKGIGVVNEILSILNHMCLGRYYFEAGLMLRIAMLHSVLLTNAETWLRLSSKDLRNLERVDEMLLRKLFETPISTPGAALYLETGTIPLKFILRYRRIMFLHHILTRDKGALISQVFWAQVNKPAPGDWCTVLQEDMEALEIGDMSFQELEAMSQDSLKNLMKKVIRNAAFKELIDRKNSLSKIASKHYESLAIQQYLRSPSTSNRHKKVQFRWRTRMTKVGWNFGNKGKCPLCKDADDTQDHLLSCNYLVDSGHDAPTGFIERIEIATRKRERILEALEVQ